MGSTVGTGSVVAGHRLGAELGRGRDGVVFAAEHLALGRERALKLLRPDVTATPAARAALLAEARVAALVEHPGLVRVHDAGTFRRRPWMALGVVEGPSLADRLASGGALDAREVAALLRALAHALDALHRAGASHRDVKPGNVLLEAGEAALPVLVDVGRAIGPPDGEGDDDGAAVPAPADDVRGLALVGWAALAGGLPGGVAAVDLPPVSTRRPELGPLDEPLARALAGGEEHGVAAVAAVLADVLDRGTGATRAAVPVVAAAPVALLADAPTPASDGPSGAPVVAVVPRRPRRRATVGRVGPALAAALVALAAGGSWAGARLGTVQNAGVDDPSAQDPGPPTPAGAPPASVVPAAPAPAPTAPRPPARSGPTDDPGWGGELADIGWRKLGVQTVRGGKLWRSRYVGKPGTRLVVERRSGRRGRYRGEVRRRMRFDTPGFGRVRGYAYDGGRWRRCTLPACVTVVATAGSGYVITVGARERDVAADEAVRAVRAMRP